MPSSNASASVKVKRILKAVGKITIYTLLIVILIFVIIVGLIQFPAIQNKIKNKVIATLTEKLHSTVKLDYIRINFSGSLVLENLFIADRQQDTVIYAGKLKVAVNPAGLIHKKVIISGILLQKSTFNYTILNADGKTNIDFIINSFSGNSNKVEPKSNSSSWDIQIRKVELEKSNFVYHNLSDSMKFHLNVGKFLVTISDNNLDALKFNIDRVLIQNTRASINTYNLAEKTGKALKEKTEDAKRDSSKSISLNLKKLDMFSVSFQQNDALTGSGGLYQIGEAHIIPKNIDLNKQKIDISSIQISDSKILYQGSTKSIVNTQAAETVAEEKSKPWKINLDKGNIELQRLELKNLVAAGGSLSYLSDIALTNAVIDVAAEYNDNKSWNVDLKTLRFEDERTSRLVSLVANANANENRISISPFSLRLGGSHIAGTAGVTLAEEKEGTIPDFNANITSSNLIIADLAPYIPPSLYPNLKRIPAKVLLVADVQSKNQNISGKGDLKTEEGNILFSGNMKQGPAPVYNVDVSLMDLNAGFFAQNPQFGRISAMLHVNGAGLNPKSMDTEISLIVPNVSYNGVIYNNIRLNGNVKKALINIDLTTKDPIADLAVKVKGNIDENPKIRINSHIGNLDLYAMKLIKDTIALSGVIDASYTSKGTGRFIASTDTLQLNVRLPKDEINTNTKLLYSVLGDSVEARVKSNFGDIGYNGNVPLQDVSGILKNYFAQYFSEQKSDSAQNSTKYFRVDVDINDLSVLNDFAGIKIDIPDKAHLSATLKDNRLISNVDFKKIIFKDMEIDNLTLDASGKDSSFQIDFKTAAFHNSFQTIKDISLNSSLRQGKLQTRLELSNADAKKWFNIGVMLEPENPELNIVIQEPLILNHRNWDVYKNNKTYIRNNNVVFNNVTISKDDKVISLLSDAHQPEKLAVSFKNLDLSLLSEIMNGDTTYLSGKINGDLMATNLLAKPFPIFDANLGINDIILENRPLGELNVKASNTKNNDIAEIDVNFGQENMKLNLNGTYGLKPDLAMNLNLTSQNLSLAAIQPLIKNVISSASGAVNASLNIKGSFSNPVVTGSIGFDKAAAFIEPIQSKFSIDQQKILFNGDVIDFKKFTIKDVDGNNLEINGNLYLANLKSLNYNLNINSDKFLAYQGPPDALPAQQNKVIVTSDIKVNGVNNVPDVNAKIDINEGSKFYYKITKHASNLTEEGIIEFKGAENAVEEKAPQTSVAENMNLTTNITVANNTTVTIITDPLRNFGLNMLAGGVFTMNQRPYQSPNLTGRLDISGGDYTLSLSGIKRKFQIADSSYIVWYGNIAQPELNLRAYYEVRTSPAELLPDQPNQSAGTLPFMVNMIISGSLENPKFSFRLSLPREYEGYENVVAKLQEINSNESDLNQKAMTLLLFGSFGFNNFANVFSNGGGTNVIISNALNQFFSQKQKFVDLHFDLQSYDNYGGASEDNLRTEMKIAASKKLIDNRLNVQLGVTVVLQADEQEQQKSIAERFSPEFNIDYLLNKPRTLSVQAFRRSEYRGLIEGKVISTGAGIVYQKDFNKISELFGKKPDDEEPVAENQKITDEKK